MIKPVRLMIGRHDECFYIYSPDVPGLHMAGRDLAALYREMPEIVTDLLRLNGRQHFNDKS